MARHVPVVPAAGLHQGPHGAVSLLAYPGTVLLREYQGERHTVTVVPNGYVWHETTYASLSTIARAITGTSWNGPRFFGLRSGAKPARDAEIYAKTLHIEKLKAQLAVPRRARFGRSSEKLGAEIEQLELLIGDLEEGQSESQAREDAGAPAKPASRGKGRREKPGRKPLPDTRRALCEPVSVNNRTGLRHAKMEIGKRRAETGARNPPRTDRNTRNCRPETGPCQPNPREWLRFSPTGKITPRRPTAWLTRQSAANQSAGQIPC